MSNSLITKSLSSVFPCCQSPCLHCLSPCLSSLPFTVLLTPLICKTVAVLLAIVLLSQEPLLPANLYCRHAALSAAMKVNSILLSPLLKPLNTSTPFFNNLAFHHLDLLKSMATTQRPLEWWTRTVPLPYLATLTVNGLPSKTGALKLTLSTSKEPSILWMRVLNFVVGPCIPDMCDAWRTMGHHGPSHYDKGHCSCHSLLFLCNTCIHNRKHFLHKTLSYIYQSTLPTPLVPTTFLSCRHHSHSLIFFPASTATLCFFSINTAVLSTAVPSLFTVSSINAPNASWSTFSSLISHSVSNIPSSCKYHTLLNQPYKQKPPHYPHIHCRLPSTPLQPIPSLPEAPRSNRSKTPTLLLSLHWLKTNSFLLYTL